LKVYAYDDVNGISEAEVEPNGKIYKIIEPSFAIGKFRNTKKIMNKNLVSLTLLGAIDIYIEQQQIDIDFKKSAIGCLMAHIETAKELKKTYGG